MHIIYTDMLWRREGVESKSPDGTKWAQICPKVRHISVGPADQVIL